jgi:fucose permease
VWAGGFWATFTIGRICAGLFAHRIRQNTLITGALVGVAGAFVVGFAIAPIFPGLVSSTSQRVGQRHAGNTIGIQISAAGFGGAVLPALAGFLARCISLETIPVLLFISLLGMLIL